MQHFKFQNDILVHTFVYTSELPALKMSIWLLIMTRYTEDSIIKLNSNSQQDEAYWASGQLWHETRCMSFQWDSDYL